jgi:hypothetical protein
LSIWEKKYTNCQICVTCRTAAEDYAFEHFTYVEIADFQEEQQRSFIDKWYADDAAKRKRFLSQWTSDGSYRFRDLAATPLLLALLCLTFDETNEFPIRCVDLYKESMDVLLKKWDRSRNVFRDSSYESLSLSRKQQLLGRVAAGTFETGRFVFRSAHIKKAVGAFFQQLPLSERSEQVEVEPLLSSIETRHGLIVARATDLYSFSHLTFHEYFAARHVLDNIGRGSLDRLLSDEKLCSDRWVEVIVMAASMLDDAEPLFVRLRDSLRRSIDAVEGLDQALKSHKRIKFEDVRRMVSELMDGLFRPGRPLPTSAFEAISSTWKDAFLLPVPTGTDGGYYSFDFVKGCYGETSGNPVELPGQWQEDFLRLTYGSLVSLAYRASLGDEESQRSKYAQWIKRDAGGATRLRNYFILLSLIRRCLDVSTVSKRAEWVRMLPSAPRRRRSRSP